MVDRKPWRRYLPKKYEVEHPLASVTLSTYEWGVILDWIDRARSQISPLQERAEWEEKENLHMIKIMSKIHRQSLKRRGYIMRAEVFCDQCEKIDYVRISDFDDSISCCSCGNQRDLIQIFDPEGDVAEGEVSGEL